MASPTTNQPTEEPRPARTPGVAATPGEVTTMKPAIGALLQTRDTRPAEPVLFDDIDPVLLVRLYPHAASGEEARAEAKKAGAAAAEAAMHLVAAQQDDGGPPPA